ncbi:MAG TPA: hypothetical protein VJ227_01245 [Patescibacteria group bacterium]|nr:hypothetical protein [Patescibacteria group bacterium]
MRKKKLPSLVTVLVLTLVTALSWVGFSIYRAFTTESPPSVAEEILSPLTPTLDQETIQKIEGALYFNDSQIPELTTTQAVTPAPTVGPLPTAEPEATSSATPEGTPALETP